jgi:CRP-like cAMP-binding protein
MHVLPWDLEAKALTGCGFRVFVCAILLKKFLSFFAECSNLSPMSPEPPFIPIFEGINKETLNHLWKQVEKVELPAGTVIVREGEPGNRLYLVGSGFVRVCKRFDQSDEVELAALTEGDFFGEMCILETLPRAATVQAVTETTVFSMSSSVFFNLHEKAPGQYAILVLNIARDLSRRLRALDEAFTALHH